MVRAYRVSHDNGADHAGAQVALLARSDEVGHLEALEGSARGSYGDYVTDEAAGIGLREGCRT